MNYFLRIYVLFHLFLVVCFGLNIAVIRNETKTQTVIKISKSIEAACTETAGAISSLIIKKNAATKTNPNVKKSLVIWVCVTSNDFQ